MKIGILTQYYPPETGAPQARLSDLAQRLTGLDHEVIVLTAMPNYPRGKIYSGYGGFCVKEKTLNVNVIRSFIIPSKSTALFPRMLNYLSFVVSSIIVGIFHLPKVDYLIVESPPLFLGLSGYLLSLCKRAKLIFNVSDLWPETAVRLGVIKKLGLKHRLAVNLEEFLYRKAWAVTGQSREILKNIDQRFPEICTYHFSNGVDVTKFKSMNKEEKSRSQCVAIYAGLHGIAQGLEIFLEAAKKLAHLDNLSFIFIGDGPEKQKLVNMAQDLKLKNVFFKNACVHEEVYRELSAADIALISLKNEIPGAVPSKIYEAMAMGLPIVLSAQGEASEIVERSQAGLVGRCGDVDAVVSALELLVRDPERRITYGAFGRKAAEKNFDRKNIAMSLEKFLAEGLC